jgi:hypothetical protein
MRNKTESGLGPFVAWAIALAIVCATALWIGTSRLPGTGADESQTFGLLIGLVAVPIGFVFVAIASLAVGTFFAVLLVREFDGDRFARGQFGDSVLSIPVIAAARLGSRLRGAS